jgi:NADPH:quinone reductase and related Zn-dependent oxidoreductases
MRAAWYERNGPAREVLTVGEMPDPVAGPGEVLVRVHASGVNPSDVKSRAGARAPIAFPRVIPQSDGAGVIVAVGDGVPPRGSDSASGSITANGSGPSARPRASWRCRLA